MKIGIITYHWAVNYGAVTQAYALRTYLKNLGHEVEFINYIPNSQRPSLIRKYFGKSIQLTKIKWKSAKRKSMFKTFSSYLKVGGIYSSIDELQNYPPKYDVYICGSDQIWNYDLVKGASKLSGVAKEYYLNFGSKSIKRIAYAPSFGSGKIPDELKDEITLYLSRFDYLSVREKSGVEMVEGLGFKDVAWMPDPTFLLKPKDYLNLELSKTNIKSNYVYSYVLEGQDDIVIKVLSILSDNNKLPVYNVFMGTTMKERNHHNITPSPEQWLHYINDSSFVVTNSFHSTVFAIIFHKPFITLPLSGKASGRNERIISLLNYLGLTDRILNDYSNEAVNKIKSQTIDWVDVDYRLSQWREKAFKYLTNALK